MANQISRILMKRSAIASHAPLAEDLQFGELSLNYNDKRLYFLNSDGTISYFDANSLPLEGGEISGSLTVKGSIYGTASKAIADENGANIATTYAKKTDLGSKANAEHTHDIEDVSGLDTALDGKLDATAKAESAKVADSVAWANVSDKPTTFTPTAHNQASDTINLMTGYGKATSASAITVNDSLNLAIGKLEKGLDGKLSSTGTAVRATSDADGNVISTTYAKQSDFTQLETTVSNNFDSLTESIGNLDDEKLDASVYAGEKATFALKSELDGKLDATAKAESAKVADSVEWTAVANKPTEFAPTSHNQASSTINKMTGYSKASSASAIATTDSLNVAIGKLEKGLDTKLATTGGTISGNLTVSGTLTATASKASALTSGTIGGEAQPVYFKNGVPVETTYQLNATVPSDAKFTDTTYSTATDTVSGLTKLYVATGTNNDGSMTQSAITTALGNKLDKTATASKATSDASGNVITTTYATKTEVGAVSEAVESLESSKLDADANAVSASKLAESHTIAISGAVTGTATAFDGTKDITINTTSVSGSKVSGAVASATKATQDASGNVITTTYAKSADLTALTKTVSGLSTSKLDVSTYNTDKATFALTNDVYTKGEVDAKVSSVYRPRGSVANYASLPTSATVGDVYNLTDTGANYVYTEDGWDKLSETVDLTPYLTKTDASSTYATIATVNGKLDKTANAVSASAWATGRKITLSGDASGNVTIDGSKDVTLTVTVADDSHAHIIDNVDGLQTALNAKAPLASPTLTGTPKAPTATAGTNTTQIATTAFVTTAVANKTSVATATKATQDGNGAVIADTYLKIEDASEQYLGIEAKAKSATVADSANAVAWTNVSGKPTEFAPSSHNQASSTIDKMTSYAKATASASIATTDSLNTAIGKLEYKVDTNATSIGTINTNLAKKANSADLATVATSGAYSDLSGVPTTLKNPTALTIKNSANTTLATYDGSEAKSVQLTASTVGLGNVTNESKATMFTSPTFTGTPKAPTATAGTNTTQIATTAFVTTAIANKTSVATATKATQDASGNVITETYLTIDDASETYLGKTAKASSATVADSANAVAWDKVTGKPTAFTPSSHNQASSTINALTGYSKPTATSALATTDTLNGALGKLEKALDGKLASGGTASKATADASGNTITTSYASSLSGSNATLTLKSKSGATLSTVTVNNVANATKATKDASGNVITTTYATKAEVEDLSDAIAEGFSEFDGTVATKYETIANVNALKERVATLESKVASIETTISTLSNTYMTKADYQAQIDTAYANLS